MSIAQIDAEAYWYQEIRPQLVDEFPQLDTEVQYGAYDIPEKVLFDIAFAFAEFYPSYSVLRLVSRISITLYPLGSNLDPASERLKNRDKFKIDLYNRLMANAEWLAVVELTRSEE